MGHKLTQGIALLQALDEHKHWTIQTQNRAGARRRYECTIWGNGRRVSASGYDPLVAVTRAVDKLNEKNKPRLKVVR